MTPAMSQAQGRSSRTVVVTHALRTPIGKYLGSFAELSAADLGASVVAELLARAGLDTAGLERREATALGPARSARGRIAARRGRRAR